jgi:hypothetical protein
MREARYSQQKYELQFAAIVAVLIPLHALDNL